MTASSTAVNGLDIALIDSHWLQTGPPSSASSVPEPPAIVLTEFGGIILSFFWLGRMRRSIRH
jgi:hypothetical protein